VVETIMYKFQASSFGLVFEEEWASGRNNCTSTPIWKVCMCMCPKNLNKSMLHLPISLFLPSCVGSSHEQQEKGSEVAPLKCLEEQSPHSLCLVLCIWIAFCILSCLGSVFLGSGVLCNLSGDLKNL
jgi:hypothetical protein